MNVALFGTGLMGGPMAETLASHGYTVTVYNRTRAKAEALAGARVALRADEALRGCECAILMLSDATAISDTLLTERTASCLEGRTVIQMGTIGPSESRRFRDAIALRRGEYLEAPVLGSIPEVRSSSLIVMVGAERGQYERWEGLLRSFGPSPILIGPVGHAAAVKLAMNQLIGALTAAFSLSLGMAARSGVDVEMFMSVVRASALYAPMFDKKYMRMKRRDYANPTFPLRLLQKDIALFIEEGAAIGLPLDTIVALGHVITSAIARSHSKDDYSALNEVLNPA